MIARHIADSVRQAMDDTPVVLLNGARQTGKNQIRQPLIQVRDRYLSRLL